MKNLLRLVILLPFFLLFLFIPIPSHAQDQGVSFELFPTQEEIDDVVEKVIITFPELAGEGYKLCLRGDMCVKSIGVKAISTKNASVLQSLYDAGFDKDDINSKYLKDLSGNSVTVCGDGETNLKTDCQDSRDYFHAGKFYLVTVFLQQGDMYLPAGRAGFYINHHLPVSEITSKNGKAPEIFDSTLTLDAPSKDGKKNSNNFQVVFEGPGIKEEKCTPDLGKGETYTSQFPSNDWLNDKDNWSGPNKPEGLIPGKYTLKINERINDGNTKLRNDDCQGGFTFIHHVCTVDDKKATVCRKIEDPNQSDAKKFAELLSLIADTGKGVPLPCKTSFSVKNPLDCDEIDTALGPISLDPIGFMVRIFSIVLSFAGVGAMILIVYAGYKLLLSRGNKETIQGARETITAAVLGLIFIVFSLVILSVIAGDLLKIPGFN